MASINRSTLEFVAHRSLSFPLFEVGLEPVEAPFPLLPVDLDPMHRLLQAFGAKAALAGPPHLLGDHEPRLLEDLHVLLQPGQRHPVRFRKFGDRSRPLAQLVEDLAASRIGQRRKRSIKNLILNHMVQYIYPAITSQGQVKGRTEGIPGLLETASFLVRWSSSDSSNQKPRTEYLMEPETRENEPALAGRREWVGLGVLALACLVYVMDLTVLHLAVPKLSADLKPTSAQLLWIIDIYGFVVAGSLITMGTLGDRIGRRRLLMIGAAAFGIVSLLAAFSTSAGMLIASRALMGVAGATLAPSTLSLIFNMFKDPKQRSIAIGWWIASFSAGSAIGPLAGGVMLECFWWGSVFLLALPVMALLLVLGPRLLPEYRDPEAGRLDLRSAGMSLLAVLAVIFGLKEIAQDGVGWLPVVAILAGIILGALFARRQSTLADPLIDLRLFRVRALSASLVTYFLSVFVAVGYFLFVAQYLQLVLELSPLQAGLWSLPSAAAFTIGSTLGPRILRPFRPRWSWPEAYCWRRSALAS